jgi:HEPN domain-containing protein
MSGVSDQCAKNGIIVAIDARLLNTLADHAVRSRYPGDEPTLDDAREALKIARMTRRIARKLLGLTR